MSHPPPLLKHPVHPAATPPASQSGLTTSPANFVPRREFIRDHRPASSFSLLAFSGSNLLRLYSFSTGVASNLRRLLNQKDLIASVREHAPKRFLEFSLEGKPWANPKSITSEKLIVDILTIILHCGYAFLSTIDYGREHDDKLAIAFSCPVLPAAAMTAFPASNGSNVSISQPTKVPFAISFSSSTLLRVVGPPLHSTPAILQAVRGAWPRGVVSDKKVGDATYEFKLKGYKWFQEDTFPMDSLNHILGLMASLDTHGFTLLTQLSFSKPSRVKDFWVFTGLADDQYSPPPTPTATTFEPRRELPPQPYSIAPGPSPLSAGAERRGLPRPLPNASTMGSGEATNGHARNASDNPHAFVSPPKNSAPFASLPANLLRRASAKTRIPSAFQPHKLERSTSSGQRNNNNQPSGAAAANAPNGASLSRSGPSQLIRSLSNPSSVGSVDMTGVGRRSVSVNRTPDVFYVTEGRQKGVSPSQEYNPFQSSLKPAAQPPHAAFIKVTTPADRRASVDSRSPHADQRTPLLRPAVRRSSTIPALDTRQGSSSSVPKLQVHAPSPISLGPSNSSDRTVGRNDSREESFRLPATATAPVAPARDGRARTPTPPLLTPGTFRDSAFSWGTHKSQSHDASGWLGAERSLSFSRDAAVAAAVAAGMSADTSGDSHDSHRSRTMKPHTGASGGAGSAAGAARSPELDRARAVPGGWVNASREESSKGGHDVPTLSPYKMFPPTIREQPSQEGSEPRVPAATTMAIPNGNAAKQSTRERERGRMWGGREAGPAQKLAERFNMHERLDEAATGEMPSGGSSRARSATTSSVDPPTSSAGSTPQPGTARRDTAMSGWVMVNVEGAGSGDGKKKKKKSSSHSPSRPTVRHRRSNSDSDLLRPQTSRSPLGNAPAAATMSAAAKTIAMIDAVEARKEESDKSMGTPSGFKRIFHRTRGTGSGSDRSTKTATLRRRQPEGMIAKNRSLDSGERERDGGKMAMRGAPPAVKPRISLD